MLVNNNISDIPEEMITQLEIPNGLPLIYDLDSKCLKLLDDGSGIDPLEKYDFGKAGKYLFQNCSDPEAPDPCSHFLTAYSASKSPAIPAQTSARANRNIQ